jgi:hypothetical protein
MLCLTPHQTISEVHLPAGVCLGHGKKDASHLVIDPGMIVPTFHKKDARHLVVAAAAFLTTFCRHEPRPIP